MFKKHPVAKQKILLHPKEFFMKLRKRQLSQAMIFSYIAVSIGFLSVLFPAAIYFVYLRWLPPIAAIEELTLSESSVIRDRNGGELYSIFAGQEGKRTYVPLSGISPAIIDALVATEDKTFFENQGIDLRSLARSVTNYLLGKTDKIQGTSTLSQQLIKIAFLSNERSMERKIKEAYLSYRLNTKYSKEKILELYLNKISFGNNASGIEEAAKTYFGKSAKDVKILGATILASLPKGPTYFSPYSHRDRLMGYLYVYKDGKTDEKITLASPDRIKDFRSLVDAFKEQVRKLSMDRINDTDVKVCGLSQDNLKEKYAIDPNGCSRLTYKDLQTLLNDIRITLKVPEAPAASPKKPASSTGSALTGSAAKKPLASTGATATGAAALGHEGYTIEYNTGRKDFVASRMLEDNKISVDDFKDVVINGLEFQFVRNTANIKYPHFVAYVQDYLTRKYGDDFFDQWGLQIYTTIDPKLQNKAEELVIKQAKINRVQYGATSASLVSIDNPTGQIVAMVGGPDYNNDAEQGKVNMTTSLRQPGSSFKPIVYSLAMSREAVGPDTPIFDVDTAFGKWNPDNYDKKFLGKMKIRTALDYSRNIPAIKMFTVAGGEASVVKHAKSLGINSLREDGTYGMPLAIGTGEVKPIEMAEAYSVFANGGWRKEADPILKIVDKKGNILDQFVPSNGKYVFSDAASYLLSVILSDASSRPGPFWNNVLTLKDRPIAGKTGTSNKEINVPGREKTILPRDLWTAGYTPQYTAVVWAGNVDGTETKGNCDGLNCAAPIWHDFMEFAHKGLPVMPFKKPDSIYTATISNITGKLTTEKTSDSDKVVSMFAVKPTKYESSSREIEVDSLCNGKVTPATPEAAIKKGFLLDLDPIVESYDPAWVAATRKWASSDKGREAFSSVGASTIASYSDTVCERPLAADSGISVGINLIDGMNVPLGKGSVRVKFDSKNPIVRIRLERDGEIFKEAAVEGEQTSGETVIGGLSFDVAFIGEHTVTAVAIDKYGYSAEASARVSFGGKVEGSKIVFENPIEGDPDISLYEGQFINLRFHIEDPLEVTAINLTLNGELYKILGSNALSVSMPFGADLKPGTYKVGIQTTNAARVKSEKAFTLTILEK